MLFVSAHVRPKKRAEFLLALQTLAPTKEDGGWCRVFEDESDPDRLCCTLGWSSDQARLVYLESERYRALRGALRTLAADGSVAVLKDVRAEPPGGSQTAESETWKAP